GMHHLDSDPPATQPAGSSTEVFRKSNLARARGGIGRSMRLDGQPATIIGVMPPAFDNPVLWGPVDLWRPIAFTPQQRQDFRSHFLNIVGRVKDGATLAQAGADMKALTARSRQERPDPNAAEESVRVESLRSSMN